MSRDSDWTEVWFSFWQPLRDRLTERWPRSQLASSSFPISSLCISRLYLDHPCPPIWGSLQDRSGARYFALPLCLLADPASEPQHRGPSHGRLAATAALSINEHSSKERESLWLLCVLTMSELIWAKCSHRIGEGGTGLLLPKSSLIHQCLPCRVWLAHFLPVPLLMVSIWAWASTTL